MRISQAFVVAVAFAFSLPSSLALAAPAGKTDHAKQSESDKKPGKECDTFDRHSDGFKDCVSKQAHGGKAPGSPSKSRKPQ